MRYVFGDCTLDTERYELRRAGVWIPLRPKVFQLLAYLITHQGRVVLKDELVEHLWPNQFIGDTALKSCIMTARKAVGDEGRTQRIIQTLHGHGYRFVAAVTTEDQPPSASATQSELSRASAPPAPRVEIMPDPVTGMPHPIVHALEQEHKQVTVLWCTLAHATTLATQLGPETMHTLMQEVFALAQRIMQRYEGTITQYMGDGFLALFGAPIAHEDRARRAVLAALELQQRLRACHTALALPQGATLTACIGLHTGPVVVGYLESDPQRLYTAVGETTHFVTRLQPLAAPGTVVISEATYRLAHGEVWGEACGSLEMAETAAPVAVYTVRDIIRQRSGVPGHHARDLSRFVGRGRELAILHERLAYATQGQGQVVGMIGEPGMGKSRLLYEFAQSLTGQAGTYREGHCLAYGNATPYLPVRDLLRQHCGITEADGPEAITAKVRRAVQEAEVTSEEAPPLLLQLLDVPIETEHVAHLSPQAQRTRTFALLRQMCLHDSQRQPLILAVENGHWIDATSEEWLTTLIERLPGASILLLVTYRPGYRPPWLEQSIATQIALPRLLPQDSLALVQSVAQVAPIPDHLARAIVTRAGGNPFFLEELTWAVVESGQRRAVLPIPETIQAVLAARIDRLPPAEKRLLQAAAVIGTDVPVPLLQAVTGMAEEELAGSLRHLQAAEFLYETRLIPALIYTFKHVLTQEVAYQSLLASARQQYHRQIAEVLTVRFPDTAMLQPELLAHHYTEADLSLQAAGYWNKAGLKANDRSAHTEAIRHLRQGLEVLTTLPDTSERARQELMLQNALGRSLQAAKGYASPEAEQVYARARELCQQAGDTPALLSVLGGLRTFYLVRAELRTARELAEHFLRLAQRLPDPIRGVAHSHLGHTILHLGELVAARTHLEHGIILCDSSYPAIRLLTGGLDPKNSCLSWVPRVLWLLGYPDQALQRSNEAITHARELAHPYSLLNALSYSADCHRLCGEVTTAREQEEACLALATDQGAAQFVANRTFNRGLWLIAQGQAEEGRVQAQQGLAAYQATGARARLPYYLAQLAEVYGRIGQPIEGLVAIAEALAQVDDTDERWWEAELYRLKGALLLVQEDPRPKWAEAEECFYQALTVARGQQAKSLELRAALSLSRLWQRQGKRKAAHQLLADVYHWFTEGFDTADLKEARALLEEFA